jgi:hypothetical protein
MNGIVVPARFDIWGARPMKRTEAVAIVDDKYAQTGHCRQENLLSTVLQ